MLDVLKTVSLLFVVIATINLGLVGLIDYDIVGKILGSVPILLQVFNVLVGISGIMMLVTYLKK
tara:strand:- start:625 stop:816 length:192 start_codon:yes stop_codon:yes gene_type:complete